MNIAIVDDDKTAARLLADKLKGFEEAHISGIAANGMDGLALVMDTNPDLLFLDIELPDISGIEFLERIADSAASDCRVVIVYGTSEVYAFRLSQSGVRLSDEAHRRPGAAHHHPSCMS